MTEPQPPADAPQESGAELTGFGAAPETVPAASAAGELQPATIPEALPTIPVAAPTITAAVECPGCGAKVRNISAEPGVKIRCLNCGTRFVAVAANSVPAAVQTGGLQIRPTDAPAVQVGTIVPDDEEDHKPKVREPKAAGYWIMRIPGIVFFSLGSVGFLAIIFFYFLNMAYGGIRRGEDLLWLAYFPLLPLLTFYFFAITRSLARVEAGTLKAAWKSGLVRESLPAVRGSSLPYLVPLACGPVVLFVYLVSTFVREAQPYFVVGPVIVLGLLSALLFILAFMCDDMRQFLWRQYSMAESCAQSVNSKYYQPSSLAIPTLGCLASASLLCFAGMTVFFLCELFFTRSSYRRAQDMSMQTTIMLLVIGTLAGASVTIFLLGRNFGRAIEAWWNAATSMPDHVRAALAARREVDIPALFVRAALYSFIIVAWMMVFYQLAATSYGPRDFELLATLAGCAGSTFVCLTLARIYASVRAWRKAQQRFWLARRNLTAKASLPPSYGFVIVGTIILAGFQSICFLGVFASMRFRLDFEEFVGLGLMTFLLHFPTVWLSLLTREFILAEQTAMQLKEAPATAVKS